MIRTVAAGLAALLLSQAPATGQTAPTPPEGLIWLVLGRLNAFYDDVENPTNRPAVFTAVPDDVLQPVEINDDGKTDWLVVWPQEMQFCGTGGCRTTLYVSTEFGLIRALDRQVLDGLKIGKVDGEVRVEAWVHHLNCIDDRPDCFYAWAWDEAASRLVPRPASDGITLLAGTGAQTIDDEGDSLAPALDSWPQAMRTVWEDSRLICLVDYNQGYEMRRAGIATVPDLNDDGRPDWVVTPATACDYAYGPSAFQVWTTTGGGETHDEVALAYTAGPATGLRTSLAAPKPALLVSQPCSGDDDCPWVPLRWNASTKSLAE